MKSAWVGGKLKHSFYLGLGPRGYFWRIGTTCKRKGLNQLISFSAWKISKQINLLLSSSLLSAKTLDWLESIWRLPWHRDMAVYCELNDVVQHLRNKTQTFYEALKRDAIAEQLYSSDSPDNEVYFSRSLEKEPQIVMPTIAQFAPHANKIEERVCAYTPLPTLTILLDII